MIGLLAALGGCRSAGEPFAGEPSAAVRGWRPDWLEAGMDVNRLMFNVVRDPRLSLARIDTEGPYFRYVYRVKRGPLPRNIISAEPAEFFTAVVREGKVVGIEAG